MPSQTGRSSAARGSRTRGWTNPTAAALHRAAIRRAAELDAIRALMETAPHYRRTTR